MSRSEMNLFKKYKPDKGYTRLIESGQMGITGLDFGILNLGVGESFFEDTGDNEVMLRRTRRSVRITCRALTGIKLTDSSVSVQMSLTARRIVHLSLIAQHTKFLHTMIL